MEFNLVQLVLYVQTENRAGLARRLMLQGADFGDVCRAAVCRWPTRTCRLCSVRDDCSWYLVFAQELTVDPDALKRHQKPPLPFSFSFPLVDDDSQRHGLFECGLVVVGRAITCLDLLLEGFADLLAGDGETVRGELVRIAARDYQGMGLTLGEGCRVTRPENLVVLSVAGILESRPWGGTTLRVELLSPLKLIRAGRQLKSFEFSFFARSLLRRVSSMAYYYGQCQLDQNFRELSRQAEVIACGESSFHYGTIGEGAARLSGVLGHGRFNGDFSELIPFLVVGRYVNVGKGASFGFGCFDLSIE